MPKHSPNQALQTAIKEAPPGRLLVAVSGGPDSVALLVAVHQAGRQITVGHVNHSLRGEESDTDEAFVRSLASRLQVPVMVERVDTAQEAAHRRMSLETAARTLRYEALERMRAESGSDWIVTGHTEDDQAETLLLRLVRGTGTTGMGGMRVLTGRIARPFLRTSRATILAALEEWGQPYRTDTSNRDPRFTRNRVRLQVVPLLQEINPRVVPRLAATAGILRADADFIDDQAARALAALIVASAPASITVSRPGWASLHPALANGVARAVIRQLLGDVSNVDEDHITDMVRVVVNGPEAAVQLPRGLRLRVHGRLATVSTGLQPHSPDRIGEKPLNVPGSVSLRSGTMTARLIPPGDLTRLLPVVGPFHALLDAELAGPRLKVRGRRPGDRVKPAGSRVTRKLQDILVDAHVPAEIRDEMPVVVNPDHIVWIPGLVVDRRASAGPESAHILHLIWTPSPPR